MNERIRWLYLVAGLVVGGLTVFLLDRYPGGDDQTRRVECRYEEGKTYMVERVVDGDTIVLSGGIHLRYLGVNTPEAGRFDYTKPEPFSAEATALNKQLVEGRQVRLALGQTKLDHYGRLLAAPQVLDEKTGQWLDVGEELLRAGMGKRMFGPFAPQNDAKLKKAEDIARAARLGVWSKGESKAEKPGEEKTAPSAE